MSNRYDVIVIGVGSMGAATCWQLAARGCRVLGLEQFGIPHNRGAHHGDSRVIRMAYFEHPDYVPLLKRAYELWDKLEHDTGQKIFHRTGGIYMGRPDGETIAGSRLAMRKYNLPGEELSREQTLERHPQFRLPDDFVGLTDPLMGFVVPEQAMASFADQAMRHGAELHGHEAVLDWSANDTGVTVRTALREYHADRIVFTGGAWSGKLLADIGIKLVVTRQVLAWVWPRKPELFAYGTLPVWVIETGAGGIHYGFPMMPNKPGFKIAQHFPATPTDPDHVERDPQPGDLETIYPAIRQFLPDADGPLLSLTTCLYSNSPDSHFIIDRHPQHERVIIAAGFSGHGFKFASGVGDALADMAMSGGTDLPIGFLSLKRFGSR